jgi:hypothetical protein
MATDTPRPSKEVFSMKHTNEHEATAPAKERLFRFALAAAAIGLLLGALL